MVLETLDRSRFTVLLESPGASLIGDRLWDRVFARGMSDNAVVIGKCFMSEPFSAGFDHVLTEVCAKLTAPTEKEASTVNIVGLPFTSRGCEHLVTEMRMLLGMMGLKVHAAIGSGCTVEQIAASAGASANVCIMPEYCKGLESFFERTHGVRTAHSYIGAPIGPSGVRSLLEDVADITGADPADAIEWVDSDERRALNRMRSSLGMSDRLKGRTYSLECESSVAAPLVGFLGSWAGMVPKAIDLVEEDDECILMLEETLGRIGCSEALGRGIVDAGADIALGPGGKVALMEAEGMCRRGIDIALPSHDQIDLMPKSILGIGGYRFLLDRIFNAAAMNVR